MKAVGAIRLGGPDVLTTLDLPVPVPGPDQVRVTVAAAAVNPTDALVRSGAPLVHARQPQVGPWVPGMDVAGVIDALGDRHDRRLGVGQAVLGFVVPHGTHGGYARQVVLPAASVVAAPRGLDLVTASTLLMNAVTARSALSALALEPGARIGVTGAAGTLGSYVVQLARHDGLHVVADAASRDVAQVQADGADLVVPRGRDVAQRMLEAVPGGVDAVADCALLGDAIVPAVRGGGRIVTFREWSGRPGRGIEVLPVRARLSAGDTGLLRHVVDLADGQVLRPRVAAVYAAAEAAAAHRRMERGGVRGRLVLDLDGLG